MLGAVAEWRRVRRAAAIICLVSASLAVVGCGLFWPAETLRYRMTVVVDTPSGERSGSSVIESTIIDYPSPSGISGIRNELKGEAVAVDLPEGRVLFALLVPQIGSNSTGYHARLFRRAVERDPVLRKEFDQKTLNDWELFRQGVRKREMNVDLVPADFPMLVTFDNLADPTSAALVDPDNLSATFGAGVSLQRISLTTSEEPVTDSIEERLDWLSSIYSRGLSRSDFSDDIPVGDFAGMFRKGFE